MANWDNLPESGQVEDRRSMGPAVLGGGLSITGVVVYLLFTYLTGGSVPAALQQLQNVSVDSQSGNPQTYQVNDNYPAFASKVLGSNNTMWTAILSKMGKSYTAPKLVLFRGATQSACGGATSQEGPHYCPRDQTVYLDETFFEELRDKLGGNSSDVAQAYVIAHEVGHHAQNELGIMDEVQQQEQQHPDQANALSVKLELQADCFAGLWNNAINNVGVLQPGEVQEALDAAAAVGDDRIQQRMTGHVTPETWTHGSAAQRDSWFNKGFTTGSLSACDTFQ